MIFRTIKKKRRGITPALSRLRSPTSRRPLLLLLLPPQSRFRPPFRQRFLRIYHGRRTAERQTIKEQLLTNILISLWLCFSYCSAGLEYTSELESRMPRSCSTRQHDVSKKSRGQVRKEGNKSERNKGGLVWLRGRVGSGGLVRGWRKRALA